ncbi:THO complex subunit 1 transcription elongation factor-domain-containing protein [Xylaria bambusicola]|uniref:THO complex subunit 1 transcription elongation factor-domain-containing protein n=1 Tax=Xylaria bambusicola TaxID=326684 RepID=UPI002008ABD8|nr:THO complex subunit 1 transcription elongation factor-domain-containing protein [Xylaria bambusicola]KAI0526468.1 THO complex subunit 1 transcription elongation factor-domain-containing protein [Xylaria bambusicola]
MSITTLAEDEVPQASAMTDLLKDALTHAQIIKPAATIEPPLTKSNFESFVVRLPAIFPSLAPDSTSESKDSEKVRLYATVETAARRIFSSMIASTSIDSPGFVRVWNLFDLLSILSDNEQCDPALLFWLVEELLDSQTVDGCRKVFDFLESRRERITAKNLKQKSLVILRSCNDLLRRLSRAEDAAFCGRVYIFMFQSIPPGDRSSVNLRGEYHVENVTAFEEPPAASDSPVPDKMDIDPESGHPKSDGKDVKSATKAVSFEAKIKPDSDKILDTDSLYPIFWSLQHFFSQPTTLFDQSELAKFKSGIEATMTAFESVEKIQKSGKGPDEHKLIPQKRKAAEANEDLRSTNNNPKYLTSRELFELEISDLYFRRHILIQAFIILDFLLSLTPQARAKIANVQQNRSVVYADKNLGEDNEIWAKKMKDRITSYIQADSDGFFFFRVVESVISRDKGWVRWKVENCPPIERPSVSPVEFNEAKAGAKRLATSRRPKAGMNSLSLAFMDERDDNQSLERLKDPAKWRLPDLAEFKNKIASDDLDLDFANSEKEKTQLLESKASKTWRALRIARRSRLAAFDKIDDWKNVDVIFQESVAEEEQQEGEDRADQGKRPKNTTPIILSGASGVGKSTLTSLLLERQKGIFNKIVRHTTRAARDGEVNGQDFHFVDMKTFNTMLDGDYFLESSNDNEVQYGTSQKLVNAPEAFEKVALIQLDQEGTQIAKDNGFSARIVFISPPSPEVLEARLRKIEGLSEEEVQQKLKASQEEIEQSGSSSLYDRVIINDDLETAYKALEEFIYEFPNGVHEATSTDEDTAMKDETNDDDANSS